MALDESAIRMLLAEARAAAAHAYAPYSGFRVGAAVLAEGRTFVGCNVENASSGLTLCAERVAVTTAIAAGARALTAVAIACPDAPSDEPQRHVPCGACRQVLAEFGAADLAVLLDGVGRYRLDGLIPQPFRLPHRPA